MSRLPVIISIACSKNSDAYIFFLFPLLQEFVENPQLFVGGSDRFDVGQGQASTCWFLSVLSSLADKPELLRQVHSSAQPFVASFLGSRM